MQSHVQQAHTPEKERERGEEWEVGAIKNFMDIAIKWEHKGVAEGLAGRGWSGCQCCLARVHEKQNVLIDETRNTTRQINYSLFSFGNIFMKFRNCNFHSSFLVTCVSHGKPKIVLQLPIDCPLDSSGPPTWTWHWILKRTKLVQWSVKRGQGRWGWKTCVCTKAEWILPAVGRRHKDLLA